MLKGHEISPLVFLLLVNVLLLILGCFLEGTTIILVILPVLMPTAQALGIDPVHFGVMAVVNIMIGLVTPPFGLLLFMMTKIAGVPLRDMVREVMPFLYVMFGALALIDVSCRASCSVCPEDARLHRLTELPTRRRQHCTPANSINSEVTVAINLRLPMAGTGTPASDAARGQG